MTLSIITESARTSFQKINASFVSFTSVPQEFKGVLSKTCVEFSVALKTRSRNKINKM